MWNSVFTYPIDRNVLLQKKRSFGVKFFACLIYVAFIMMGSMSFGMSRRLKEEYDENGILLCVNYRQYSCDKPVLCVENLCSTCEFKDHSERYTGCLFCRMPTRKVDGLLSRICAVCSGKVPLLLTLKLIQAGVHVPHNSLGSCVGDVISKALQHEGRDCIPGLISSGSAQAVLDARSKGLCLYRGAMIDGGKKTHFWVNDFCIDEADVRRDEGEDQQEHVARLFEKYGFFGPATGTVLDRAPDYVCATYEESIPAILLLE